MPRKPKTPDQAWKEYESKKDKAKREAARLSKGLSPRAEQTPGAAERRYQTELEARSQLTIFDAIGRHAVAAAGGQVTR